MIKLQRRLYLLFALLALLTGAGFFLLSPAHGAVDIRQAAPGPIYQADVDGVITTFTVGYLRRILREAEASDATALIIQLSSEGAVLRDLRPLAVDIARARIPVVVYVAPPGTRSGAAGTFLLSAAHIAALAPATSFGSAGPLASVENLLTEQTRNLLFDEVAKQLRDWNERAGRNSAWIEQAVREGILMNNEQAAALTPPAVNLVARDNDELLILLDGRVVQLESGLERRLDTLGRTPILLGPSLWEQILMLLASPTVAFLLLVMAAIALYAEAVTPSLGLLAGLGVILLIGALTGLFVLPIQWLSLLLLLLAFAVMGADLFVPSHGALTVIGLVLLLIGALNLFDPAQAPGVAVAWWAVVVVALFAVTFATLAITLVVRTRGRQVATGIEGLVGRLAEVRVRLAPEGMVFVEGALWRAVSEDGEVEVGEIVQITTIHDLRLTVRRIPKI